MFCDVCNKLLCSVHPEPTPPQKELKRLATAVRILRQTHWWGAESVSKLQSIEVSLELLAKP